MNPLQMAQQIKHELATVAWPGGSVVFGSRGVYVVAGPPAGDEHPPGFPFALITLDAGAPDQDDPDIIEQLFSVATAVQVAGDNLGEHAVIGGSTADRDKSAGKGVAEVAERVRFALERLTAFDGAAVVVSGAGTGAPRTLAPGKHVAFDSFQVRALCTSRPRYLAPQELRVAGDTWSWRGPGCTARYDFVQFRLGFVTGEEPAASSDDLEVIIYNGTDTEFAATPVPGRVYHVFADYQDRNGGDLTPSLVEVGSYLRQ